MTSLECIYTSWCMSTFIMVSTIGMLVPLKADLCFPIPGQQGHVARIVQVLFTITRDSSSITILLDCLPGYAKCFGYGSDRHYVIVIGTDKVIHVHFYFHPFLLLRKILNIKILQDVFQVVNLFSRETN